MLLLLVGAAAGRCVRGHIVIRTTFSNGQLVRQETEGAESCEEDEDHSDEDDEYDDGGLAGKLSKRAENFRLSLKGGPL